jgi:thymidylate synthase
MNYIDVVYMKLVKEILNEGIGRETRNGKTLSVFGTSIKFDIAEKGLPLLSFRKIFTKGVVGEFLGFLQDATTAEEFQALGCSYWDLWADEDGKLELDYPPREQWETLIEGIKKDPGSRRHLINVWNHKRLDELSLPCCHYSYQFFVRGNQLDLVWTQRSLDVAIGLPSDLILATLYLAEIGRRTGLTPGRVTMNFGDCHIYEEHLTAIEDMITYRLPNLAKIDYKWDGKELTYDNYFPYDKIDFLLKE